MKSNIPIVSIEILQNLEPSIATALDHPNVWLSKDIDYHPPRVERLWTMINNYRIFLHYIHSTSEKCLFHKHRWPAAFKQVSGSYEVGITHFENEISSEEASNLPIVSKFLLKEGSYYEMTQTDTLHYVKPMSEYSLSIMVTKDLYPEADVRKESLNRKLESLTSDRVIEILNLFKNKLT